MSLSTRIKNLAKKDPVRALQSLVRKDLEQMSIENASEIARLIPQYFQPGWRDCKSICNDEPVKEMTWLNRQLAPDKRADLFCRDFYFVDIDRLPKLRKVLALIFGFGASKRGANLEASREVSDSVYVMY